MYVRTMYRPSTILVCCTSSVVHSLHAVYNYILKHLYDTVCTVTSLCLFHTCNCQKHKEKSIFFYVITLIFASTTVVVGHSLHLFIYAGIFLCVDDSLYFCVILQHYYCNYGRQCQNIYDNRIRTSSRIMMMVDAIDESIWHVFGLARRVVLGGCVSVTLCVCVCVCEYRNFIR